MQLLLRPVFRRLEHRIRAHVLICWLGSCSPASPNAPEAKAGAISAARPPASSNSPLPARPRPSPRRPAATRPEGHLPGTITIHHTTATGHRLRSHLKPARRTAPAWTYDHAPLSPHSRSSNARCRGTCEYELRNPGHSPGHVGTAGLMTTGHARVHCACTGCGRRSSKGKRINARRKERNHVSSHPSGKEHRPTEYVAGTHRPAARDPQRTAICAGCSLDSCGVSDSLRALIVKRSTPAPRDRVHWTLHTADRPLRAVRRNDGRPLRAVRRNESLRLCRRPSLPRHANNGSGTKP